MLIHLDHFEKTYLYGLMTQTILPRPVAWILTANENGSLNLAPFSYFNAVTSEPPLVMVSIGRKRDGHPKDTWRNLIEREFATIHLGTVPLADALNASAVPLPAEESEIDHLNLPTERIEGFPLPRLKEAPVAYTARLERLIEVGKQGLFLLQLESLWIDPKLIHGEAPAYEIDAAALDPLARLGGKEYAALQKPFVLERPR